MRFDDWDVPVWTAVTAAGIDGEAATDVMAGVVLAGGLAIPPRIFFHTGEGAQPRIEMGIEMRNGAPTCTYLGLLADDEHEVRAKDLKVIRVEEWVTQIVSALARKVEPTSKFGARLVGGPATPDRLKAVERMQRRRHDPRKDRALLEQVAQLYREHPEAPNKAIAAQFGVSERTAGRWAQYASEAELLPKAGQGKKRL